MARSDPGFSRRKEHKGIAQFVRFFDRIFNLLFRWRGINCHNITHAKDAQEFAEEINVKGERGDGGKIIIGAKLDYAEAAFFQEIVYGFAGEEVKMPRRGHESPALALVARSNGIPVARRQAEHSFRLQKRGKFFQNLPGIWQMFNHRPQGDQIESEFLP